ncbi:MAG: tryptophan--tRNA ligase [bacterium]|nr:tryptophan--tRNA ligase [bacterium]
MARTVVVSGIQPSGELHIGNYLGAIKHWLELQKKHTCYFFIADWHSLTEDFDPKKKKQQLLQLAVDLLALGLDPKKSTLFVQSDVKEHAELSWILNCVTPIAELERMTQFKDKSGRQDKNINAGLFTYPVLQAADILMYDATLIPVGEDQVQHVELTRDIARKFNNRFGKTFIEPKALLTKTARVKSLLEPEKKMSKSLGEGHYIALRDTPEVIHEKIKRAVTDVGAKGDEMSAGVANLFLLLQEFGTPNQYKKFMAAHRAGSLRYSELKPVVADAIASYLAPFRKRVAELEKNPAKVWKIYTSGARVAQKTATKKLSAVRDRLGLI